ncbi:1-deoxy-D-xylulose-5-phosphate reductoisomerase [Helicobacter sp. MIT 05-5294]|uniref:1-deoxy-D-xylulose-5-phosphate reductoisomerase n=1 Tax=Helicobacter sp. MIT 05-5294 TaxID=1548150 RepID=UPI00051FF26F|nr:1-deoxy-D-xylulose-5-phosphate reductoisomerase [Helicobacter sp. MIT 05-5294]TLD85712.1 1-deoxy-D-xylulose-5-phosphate reductoisomerase [Helicobacter sp. MIT 05-5294]
MILLGSTGSIGVNTLKIAKRFHIEVEMLGAGSNITLLNAQISEHNPKAILIAKECDIPKITSEFQGEIYIGKDGILKAIRDSNSPLVLNALSGFLGLEPTLCAISCGKVVALANKESLVAGGELIDISKIIPIDSEHFSLSYLLGFSNLSSSKNLLRPFKNLYITASGGAFRDMELQEIPHQNAANALKHPNWQMGKKITIDSATMVNKLFEILEAYWLFGSKNIDALIEKNSHIHALVEFWDGSVVAHFANANMQLPIAYALCLGLGLPESFLHQFTNAHQTTPNPIIEPLNFQTSNYHLQNIETARYPLWNLKNILLENPKLGLALNAANEIAVNAFLQDSIPFGAIHKIVQDSMQTFNKIHFNTLEEILALDEEIRNYARGKLALH